MMIWVAVIYGKCLHEKWSGRVSHWSSGLDSELPIWGAQVLSLVKELDPT